MSFPLDSSALSYWDTGTSGWVEPHGTFQAMIGDSASGIRAAASFPN